jgi:hypothetical protein
VETLQGLTGADFEGYCRVTRGNRSARCFASIDSEPVSHVVFNTQVS